MKNSFKYFNNVVEYQNVFLEDNKSFNLFPALRDENMRYYKGVQVEDYIMPLEQAMKKDDRNIRKHFLMVGSGGTGKSFTLYSLWKKNIINREDKIIYISLNEYNVCNQDKFLPVEISRYYFDNDENLYLEFLNQASSLHKERNVILLLDGFNEIVKVDKQIILREIRNLSCNFDINIIVTSRYDIRNYYGFYDYEKLEVLELDEVQIESYLKEKAINMQEITPNLLRLFRNPMMLLLYCEIEGIVERGKNIVWLEFITRSEEKRNIDFTVGEIIWNYLESCIAKLYFDTQDILLALLSKIIIFYCLPKLCWKMYKEKRFNFGLDEFNSIIINIDRKEIKKRFRQYFNLIQNEEIIWEELKAERMLEIVIKHINIVSAQATSSFNWWEEEKYIITHHYYRDFLIALFVVNEIRGNSKVPEVLTKECLPLFIVELIGNILGEHYNVPIYKENQWSVEHFSNTIIRDALSKISDLEEGEANVALQNIINIWDKARKGVIVNEIFKDIDMSHCNLSNLTFSVIDKNREVVSKFVHLKAPLQLKQFLHRGHMGIVNSLCFTSDFKFLASASTDCTIKIWKVYDDYLKLYKTLSGHSNPVMHIKFSNDGNNLISCSIRSVRKWNIQKETSKILFSNGDLISFFDIDDNEKNILICRKKKSILEYNLESATYQEFGNHEGAVQMVKYIPNAILSCSSEGEIYEWDEVTKKISYRYSKVDCAVNDILYMQRENLIVAATDNDGIHIYKRQGKRFYRKKENNLSVTFLGQNRDGTRLISCGADKEIHEWEFVNGKLKKISDIIGHGGRVNCAIYNQNANRIYSGAWDNSIIVWEALIGIQINKIEGTRNWINSIYLGKAKDKMLVSCWNGDIQEWELYSGKCIRIYKGHMNVVNKAIYNHNESKILSCSYDNTIKEWDVNTTRCLRTLYGHKDCVADIQYCEDESSIVSCSYDKKVIKWKLYSNGEYEKYELGEHCDYINGIALNSNGKKMISWSDDGSIYEWQIEDGSSTKYDIKSILEEQDSSYEIKFATYIDDKQILFVSWQGIIGIVDKYEKKKKLLYKFDCPELQFESVTYCPKLNVVALGGTDNMIHEIILGNNEEIILEGPTGLTKQIVLTNTGEVYSGGWDGKVYYWENNETKGRDIFSVLMGMYIKGCHFENCEYLDEQTKDAICTYGGYIE